jgi:hypothetical protein
MFDGRQNTAVENVSARRLSWAKRKKERKKKGIFSLNITTNWNTNVM